MTLSERLTAIGIEVPEVEAVFNEDRTGYVLWSDMLVALVALVGVIERQHITFTVCPICGEEFVRPEQMDMVAENVRLKAEVEKLKWMLDRSSEFYIGQDEGYAAADPDTLADLEVRWQEAHQPK